MKLKLKIKFEIVAQKRVRKEILTWASNMVKESECDQLMMKLGMMHGEEEEEEELDERLLEREMD